MKATFVGDPSQPKEAIPDTITHLGLVFEKGKETAIPPALEKKFAGNNHFEVSGNPSGRTKA